MPHNAWSLNEAKAKLLISNFGLALLRLATCYAGLILLYFNITMASEFTFLFVDGIKISNLIKHS